MARNWVGAILTTVAIFAAVRVVRWIHRVGIKEKRRPAGAPQSTLIVGSDRVQALSVNPVTSLKSHLEDREVEKYHAS